MPQRRAGRRCFWPRARWAGLVGLALDVVVEQVGQRMRGPHHFGLLLGFMALALDELRFLQATDVAVLDVLDGEPATLVGGSRYTESTRRRFKLLRRRERVVDTDRLAIGAAGVRIGASRTGRRSCSADAPAATRRSPACSPSGRSRQRPIGAVWGAPTTLVPVRSFQSPFARQNVVKTPVSVGRLEIPRSSGASLVPVRS